MTKSQRMRDSAVMISSTMPSPKYSCSGSPLILAKGSTAIDGLSGNGPSLGRGSRHHRGKAIAAPWNGLDAAALRPPLVEDPAKRGNLHGQVASLDDGAWPHRIRDLV